MRYRLRYLVVAVVATAGLVGIGLAVLGATETDDPGGAAADRHPTAPFRSMPLAAYDTSDLVIDRQAFCNRIDPRQVTSTLVGRATSQRSWDDGDRTSLAAGLTDVAHEFGCEYVGADGISARAWVFAPPVGRKQAARWAKATGEAGETCTTSAATFGSPSGLLACTTVADRSATYHGLFGDAWLTCQVVVPLATSAATVADQAGRWCVGVAQAAASR